MIDYIKAVVRDNKVLRNRKIDWCETVNTNTGELLSTLGKISCFRIKKKQSGLLILEGSLHKLSNGGAHNCNDFDYSSVVCSIGHLSHLLEVEPSSIDISNVEFGVNLLTHEPSETYINQTIGYSTKAFNVYHPDKHPDTIGKTSRHSQFILKLYQKPFEHNGVVHDILRYEYKAKKMEILHKKGIAVRTLADLGNKDNLAAISQVLIDSLNNLTMVDTIDFESIEKQSEKDILYNFTANRETMCPKPAMYPSKQLYTKERNAYYKQRKQFFNLVEKHQLNTLHTQLKTIAREKIDSMLN